LRKARLENPKSECRNPKQIALTPMMENPKSEYRNPKRGVVCRRKFPAQDIPAAQLAAA
jgi:hypothetical protein